ncbi:MAG TPA: beta-galactosidase [Clostridiales bacterium]|nr:beta-galactosidase [Clostridiales bacterium]
MGKLTTEGRKFLLDGKPFRIISGAMHYWRVMPIYWEDRMIKMKEMGCNTIETYVPWKLHEPKEGEFHFENELDVVKYIETAKSLGLYVIFRPGPYICAELDFGGFPGWLIKDKNIELRSFNEAYLSKVENFFNVLLKYVKPLTSSYGGPIIALQIENEYGAFGTDKKYLNALKDIYLKNGINELFFTSDNPEHHMIQGGSLEDTLITLNFGSGARERFPILDQYQENKPYMVMEFWIGWFDTWGLHHHTRNPVDAAKALDEILSMGASVNIYMFHGGTNFGFTNGANRSLTSYDPTINSYDYDAILDECGDPTQKYYLFRDVIAKYVKGVNTTKKYEPAKKRAYGKVALTEQANLFDSLDQLSIPVQNSTPLPMEKLGQDMGFVLYRSFISGKRKEDSFYIQDVKDRAILFLDQKPIRTFEHDGVKDDFRLAVPPEGYQVDILVESLGRANYGPYMDDYKGITKGVRYQNQFIHDWTMVPLPLNDVSQLEYHEIAETDNPAFYRGIIEIGDVADTFMILPGFTKGIAFINGFNLGRYWEKGPTQTLYIPKNLLKTGKNEIVVFELHGTKQYEIELIDHLVLG